MLQIREVQWLVEEHYVEVYTENRNHFCTFSFEEPDSEGSPENPPATSGSGWIKPPGSVQTDPTDDAVHVKVQIFSGLLIVLLKS